MSLPVLLAAGVLGGLGAVLRFLLDGTVAQRLGRAFPYGTLVVNLTGAFVLGICFGLALAKSPYTILGTGLIGGYTTFSTWMLESHRLIEDGRARPGVLNWIVSLGLGVGAALLGRHVGIWL